MILVRYRNNQKTEIVFEGNAKEVILEIHKRDLCD